MHKTENLTDKQYYIRLDAAVKDVLDVVDYDSFNKIAGSIYLRYSSEEARNAAAEELENLGILDFSLGETTRQEFVNFYKEDKKELGYKVVIEPKDPDEDLDRMFDVLPDILQDYEGDAVYGYFSPVSFFVDFERKEDADRFAHNIDIEHVNVRRYTRIEHNFQEDTIYQKMLTPAFFVIKYHRFDKDWYLGEDSLVEDLEDAATFDSRPDASEYAYDFIDGLSITNEVPSYELEDMIADEKKDYDDWEDQKKTECGLIDDFPAKEYIRDNMEIKGVFATKFEESKMQEADKDYIKIGNMIYPNSSRDFGNTSTEKILADTKKAYDREQEEKAQAIRKAELEKIAAEKVAEIKADWDSNDDKLEILFKHLVPRSGKADTVAGELVRAMMKILYRAYNDGDVFYDGYGKETCGAAAAFICDKLPDFEKDFVFLARSGFEDAEYRNALDKISAELAEYIMNNTSLLAEENEEDMYDYGQDYFDDYVPTYDYDPDLSGDLEAYIDHDKIDWSDVGEFLENFLRDLGIDTSKLDQWARDAFTITGLTASELESVEREFGKYLDYYLGDLESEFGSAYELDEEEEEEEYEDEEDLEESKLREAKDFDIDAFEEMIPHNMRYKHWEDCGDLLYWVTQEDFNDDDLEIFKKALATTGFRCAYVIVRDYSRYNRKEDFESDLGYFVEVPRPKNPPLEESSNKETSKKGKSSKRSDIKTRNYLLAKEEVAGLDDEERWTLQDLIQKYGKYEESKTNLVDRFADWYAYESEDAFNRIPSSVGKANRIIRKYLNEEPFEKRMTPRETYLALSDEGKAEIDSLLDSIIGREIEESEIKEEVILTPEQEDVLWNIANRYCTSVPVSGSWKTETEHEINTIMNTFGISKKQAIQCMKKYLGWTDEELLMKESVMSGEIYDEDIKDSYDHFVRDLGRVPSVDDVVDYMFYINPEYADYWDQDPITVGRFYNSVKAGLRQLELEVLEESKIKENRSLVTPGSAKEILELLFYKTNEIFRNEIESSKVDAKFDVNTGDVSLYEVVKYKDNDWPIITTVDYNTETGEYSWESKADYPEDYDGHSGNPFWAAGDGEGWGQLLEDLADELGIRGVEKYVDRDLDYHGKYKESRLKESTWTVEIYNPRTGKTIEKKSGFGSDYAACEYGDHTLEDLEEQGIEADYDTFQESKLKETRSLDINDPTLFRKIPLRDKIVAAVVGGVLTQLSDGYWEGSSSSAKYWKFARVANNSLFVSKLGYQSEQYPGRNKPVFYYNGFYDKSDAEIKKFFARKAKALVKAEKNYYRKNSEKSKWLELSIADIYSACDWLMGKTEGLEESKLKEFKSGDLVSVVSDYNEVIPGYKVIKKVPQEEIPGYFEKSLDDYWEVEKISGFGKGERSVEWGQRILKESKMKESQKNLLEKRARSAKGLDDNVKEWYTSDHFSDTGKQIREDLTFRDLLMAIMEGNQDVQDILGTKDYDWIMNNQVCTELANRIGVSPKSLTPFWLGESKMKESDHYSDSEREIYDIEANHDSGLVTCKIKDDWGVSKYFLKGFVNGIPKFTNDGNEAHTYSNDLALEKAVDKVKQYCASQESKIKESSIDTSQISFDLENKNLSLEDAELLKNIDLKINSEDYALFVKEIKDHLNLEDIKKVEYTDSLEGYDGAYKVTLRDGSIKCFDWQDFVDEIVPREEDKIKENQSFEESEEDAEESWENYSLFVFDDESEYNDFENLRGFTDYSTEDSCYATFHADDDEEALASCKNEVLKREVAVLCRRYSFNNHEPIYIKYEGRKEWTRFGVNRYSTDSLKEASPLADRFVNWYDWESRHGGNEDDYSPKMHRAEEIIDKYLGEKGFDMNIDDAIDALPIEGKIEIKDFLDNEEYQPYEESDNFKYSIILQGSKEELLEYEEVLDRGLALPDVAYDDYYFTFDDATHLRVSFKNAKDARNFEREMNESEWPFTCFKAKLSLPKGGYEALEKAPVDVSRKMKKHFGEI